MIKQGNKIKYGIVVIIGVIVCVSLFFGIRYGLQVKEKRDQQKKEIQEFSQRIENIYQKEKNQFLDGYIMENLEDYYKKYQEVGKEEELKLEEKWEQIQELANSMTSKHEENKKKMVEDLDKSASIMSDSKNTDYCFANEKKLVKTYLSEYKRAIQEENYKNAKNIIAKGEKLLNKVNDDSGDESEWKKWEGGIIPFESPYMVEELELEVALDKYRGLAEEHFTIYETVGDNQAKKVDFSLKHYTEDKIDDGNILAYYTIDFVATDKENYESKRTITVHVRNSDGTEGTTIRESYVPKNVLKLLAEEGVLSVAENSDEEPNIKVIDCVINTDGTCTVTTKESKKNFYTCSYEALINKGEAYSVWKENNPGEVMYPDDVMLVSETVISTNTYLFQVEDYWLIGCEYTGTNTEERKVEKVVVDSYYGG